MGALSGAVQGVTRSHPTAVIVTWCATFTAGDCQVFPVMYGEFGSALEEERDLRVGMSQSAATQTAAELAICQGHASELCMRC